MKVLRWLGRHWYVPLVILVGVFAFFAGRSPRAFIRDELDTIDAGEKARVDAANRMHDDANEAINDEYRETIAVLDEKQRRKADRLRSDPGARAKWLTRLSKRSG